MNAFEFIEGHEKVLAVFGQWPSFHDGEVLRMVLDRRDSGGAGTGPSLELVLRGWVMTADVDEEGLRRPINDSTIRILFEGVTDLDLEGFNGQNVISALNLRAAESNAHGNVSLHVELEHCFLFSSEFKATRATVLEVSPYVKPRMTLSESATLGAEDSV